MDTDQLRRQRDLADVPVLLGPQQLLVRRARLRGPRVLLEPVDHFFDLDGLAEVLVDGVVDEALLVPALLWR